MQVGDLVRLKSGGPIMTVSWVEDRYSNVGCNWFNQHDELKSATFQNDELRSVREDEL